MMVEPKYPLQLLILNELDAQVTLPLLSFSDNFSLFVAVFDAFLFFFQPRILFFAVC